MSLSDLFSRRRADAAPAGDGDRALVQSTKVLSRFVAGIGSRPQPVVLDLGPVVGTNVAFFGEQFGCKVIVADVLADVDRHVQAGTVDDLAAALAARIGYDSDSVDGVLCWDVFDYLGRDAASSLARELVRVLRPEGVLLALFGTAEPRPGTRPSYTRHTIVDETNLEYRPYAAARARQRPLPNREIQRLFEPLKVADQFLLRTNLRELLLRKPAGPAGSGTPSPES